MKILFVLSCFLALKGSVFSQNAQYDWAQNADNILGVSLTSDALGNVYCAGFFKNTVDFDPGSGVFNLTSNGDLDIFVSKKDPSGNLIWVKKIGGSLEDTPTSIKLDNSGNVLITGSFKGTCDFDPGSNSFNLTSAGDADIFICKLNPSGNFIWSKQMGGTGMDIGNSLATDQAGNIYTSGYFRYTVDFDPGAGVVNFVSGGTFNSFILKLNESGHFMWAKQFNGSSSVFAYSLTLDQFGNVYTTGWYYDTVDFDPSASTYNLTSSGLSDAFVCKLDTLGNFIWAKTVGQASGGDDARSVVTDGAGNVYVSGFFKNTVDFDPNGGIFNLSTSGGSWDDDGFILKLSGGGNFLWAKQIAGTNQSSAEVLDIDNSSNLYITGYFYDTQDFDPGVGVYNLAGVGNRDVFIQKLDSSGSFVWAKQIAGSGNEQSFAIEVDVNRNIYTVGTFENTVDFNTEAGVYNLNANGLPGSLNGFTHKLKNECLSPVSSTIVSQTNVSCNGENNGSATVNASGGTGTLSYSWSPGGGNTNTATGLVAGTYTCTITDVNLCSSTQTVTITQPTALSVAVLSQSNISCNGGNNGTAAINTPTGGAGGYMYNWTPGNPAGDGTTSVTGLTAGTWTCTVTDANGCTGTQTVTITQPTALSVAVLSQTNINCNGGNNGTAAINTPTGGAGGYMYNWTPGNPSGDGTTSVTGLTAGTWTCTVTDANGCTGTQNFTITEPTALSVSALSQTNINCNGGSNGTAAINTPTGGAGGYMYNWTPGNPSGDGTTSVTGLTAGTWTCTVTDANGCTGTQNFTITEPTALSVSALSQTNINCNGGSNGTAAINTPTGGAGGYMYNWTPGNPAGDGTTSVTGLTAGTWICTVTDENGCSNAQNFLITQAPEITSIIAEQNNVSCNGFNDGAVTINASGGTGILNFSWSPSGGNSSTAVALTAGNYICTITDVNGCVGSQVVTITEPLPIDITITVSGITVTSNQNGASYQWIDCNSINQTIPGAIAQSFTPTTNGSYAVVVSFGNLCADTSDCVVISTIGLNEKELEDVITVYPNPGQGIFFIESKRAITATITDVFGKVITNMELKEGSNQIDLSTQARGVYYIQLDSSYQNQLVKRIIQN